MASLEAVVLIVGLVLLRGCWSQVSSPGRCPKVPVKPWFQLNRYLGTWFEDRRFFAAFQIDNTCVSANYALNLGGSVRVENRGYSPNQGRYVSVVGDAFSPDPHQAAKIKSPLAPKDGDEYRANEAAYRRELKDGYTTHSTFKTVSPYQDYWVLDTDYDSFSVVYSCTDSPQQKIKNEFCWILTRRPYALHPIQISRIYHLLLAYGINPGNFLPPTQQKFCPRYDTVHY